MLGQSTVPKKICILRLSAIGDVCHAVAMVQYIQRYSPESEITWIVGKIEAQLLKGMPGVRFVVFDKKAGLQGYKDLKQALNDEQFDVLLHMQVALRASIASLMIKAKVKIGFDKARAKEGQWLFTNRRVNAQSEPHVAEGFMAFAQALGLPEAKPTWHIDMLEEDVSWAEQAISGDKPIAILCPAASKAERNWHSKGYAKVADSLIERGFTVAICGGPTALEQKLAADIAEAMQHHAINLIGKTSLKQLHALLKRAHMVIAPDTGPAHMAVTVGTPVVGLYAHSNPMRTGPYLSQDFVVSAYQRHIESQQGKSLAQIPWGTRAKGETLMNDILVEDVLNKVNALIAHHYPELT